MLSRPKSDPAKLAMAARQRQETTLLVKAIASRIHLGISKSSNIRLHTVMAKTVAAPIAKTTSAWDERQWTTLRLDPFSEQVPQRHACSCCKSLG